MDVTLPADLTKQVEQELANGHYRSRERQCGQERLDALRRIGQAVDRAGLYGRVLIPDQQ